MGFGERKAMFIYTRGFNRLGLDSPLLDLSLLCRTFEGFDVGDGDRQGNKEAIWCVT